MVGTDLAPMIGGVICNFIEICEYITFSEVSKSLYMSGGITGIALEMNCRPKHLRANTALNYTARSFFPSAPLKAIQHFAKNQ
jgi:hypothetical protein